MRRQNLDRRSVSTNKGRKRQQPRSGAPEKCQKYGKIVERTPERGIVKIHASEKRIPGWL